MRFLTKKIFLFLLAAFLFQACSKENLDEIVVTEDPVFQPDTIEVNNLVSAMTTNGSGGLDLGCFSIDYPFDLLQESGDIVTINSQTDFETALMGTGPDQIVDFVFPLTITYDDGNSTQIDDIESLGMAFAACVPPNGWGGDPASGELLPAFLLEDYCFDLSYPVDLEDANGNSYTVANETEFIDLTAVVDTTLFFVLPITLIDEDGNEVVVTDMDSFFTALIACGVVAPPTVIGDGAIVIEGFGCNTLVFPFDVETTDGSIVTVNDEDEYANLLLSGAEIFLSYPFDLINGDGETITINDEDDLIQALNDCGGFFIEIGTADLCDTPAHVLLFFNTGPGPCGYNINFPLQLEAGGQVFDINEFVEYFDVYNAYTWDEIEIVYPVSVTLIDDGSVVTFEEDDDICAFFDDCN